METFLKEKKYLDKVLSKIDDEIELSQEKIKELIKTGNSLSFEDRKRGEHFQVNSKADAETKKIKLLKKSIPQPYFGRIDISFSGSKDDAQKFYIGRTGISSENQNLVTDWRAPISSLYYDSEVGRVSYDAPYGKMNAEMTLKRQINIKNSKLIDVQDSSLVTNDELLKPYLSTNADNRMKIIIASIQKEQNNIIRQPANKNLIVQGVAGSGKTSVALHRIAYLMYQMGEKLSPDNFLVLGPNDYFLNYVSSILPDLDTTPVEEKTFFNFALDYIGEKMGIKEENEAAINSDSIKKIQNFKTSLQYKKCIDNFMDNYMNSIIKEDFAIENETIFTKEYIKKILLDSSDCHPDFNKLFLVLSQELKNNIQSIYVRLNKKYRDIYTSLSSNDPKRKEAVSKSNALYAFLKNNSIKELKKYIKRVNAPVLDIYAQFISSISIDDTLLNEKEKLEMQKNTLGDIKKKKVGFEDLAALIYIYYRMTNKKMNYKQIIIDEAQDYGMFHFYVIKEINPTSNYAIYGDIAQSIYSYRSIDSWEDVIDNVFADADLLHLNKSYRTTMEITNNANKVLNYLELEEANPVIRHGSEVEFSDKDILLDKIYEMLEKDYKTIAIICKTEKEAKAVDKLLKNNGLNSNYVGNKNDEYVGGICVLTASSSKGLEFDGVIINDASSKNFDVDSEVDMHLLYVACTRALHELVIKYNNSLVEVFSDDMKKGRQKTI